MATFSMDWFFFLKKIIYIEKICELWWIIFLLCKYSYQPFALTSDQNAFISMIVAQCLIFSALLQPSLYCTERCGAAGKWKQSGGWNVELLRVTWPRRHSPLPHLDRFWYLVSISPSGKKTWEKTHFDVFISFVSLLDAVILSYLMFRLSEFVISLYCNKAGVLCSSNLPRSLLFSFCLWQDLIYYNQHRVGTCRCLHGSTVVSLQIFLLLLFRLYNEWMNAFFAVFPNSLCWRFMLIYSMVF